MMAKVIKLTDNSAVTLLPITDSAYVQHKWKEGATGGTTITSVRDALNNVIDRVDGVHASGSDNQHLSGTGTALASANNSSVAYIDLDGNGGKVGIQGTAGTSATNQVGQADVIVSYDTASGQPNNIRIKVSYRDTNTDHYDKITLSSEVTSGMHYGRGLKIFNVATVGTATGSTTGDYYVPTASESGLGVVRSSITGQTPYRYYKVQVDDDGTMIVNVPWTDTVPDWKNTYAPIGHVDSKATTTAYGHVIVDAAIKGTSENPVQNKAINTALSGKAATGHTHTLNWTTNAKTTDAGTEIAALVAVPSSGTSLGQSAGTATFTTYTLPTKKYVDNKIGDIGSALNFKGTVGPNETQKALPTSGVKVGDVWLVKLASGTNTDILSGQTLENGDMIIATNSSPVAWTVVNANWTATDGTQSVTVGASSPTTLATIGGVAIDIKVAQEADVVHKSDLKQYINGLNNIETSTGEGVGTGKGVVTGAIVDFYGGTKKLTLWYSDLSQTISGGTGRSVISEIKQDSQGKISVVTTNIATMKAATGSNDGLAGFVPDPPAGSQDKVLTGDAKFKAISASQGNHATGLLYKTMDTTEEFTLFDDTKFTGSPVSLATIASPAITVSLS